MKVEHLWDKLSTGPEKRGLYKFQFLICPSSEELNYLSFFILFFTFKFTSFVCLRLVNGLFNFRMFVFNLPLVARGTDGREHFQIFMGKCTLGWLQRNLEWKGWRLFMDEEDNIFFLNGFNCFDLGF